MRFDRSSYAGMPYRFHAPQGAPGKLPLIVFLHGVGERGVDNEVQLSYRFFKEPDSLFGAATLAKYPSHILAPQAPATDKWVDVASWGDVVRTAAQPTPALAKVWALIGDYVKRHSVDRRRIYVAGLSMGGFGVFDLLVRHPGFFAGAVAVCGGGDTAKAALIAKTPLFLFHGTKDTLVPVAMSQAMAKQVKAAGGQVHYQEYAQMGHLVWDAAFSDQNMIAWLFELSRAESSQESPR